MIEILLVLLMILNFRFLLDNCTLGFLINSLCVLDGLLMDHFKLKWCTTSYTQSSRTVSPWFWIIVCCPFWFFKYTPYEYMMNKMLAFYSIYLSHISCSTLYTKSSYAKARLSIILWSFSVWHVAVITKFRQHRFCWKKQNKMYWNVKIRM